MLELHYGPGTCSFVVHAGLETIRAAIGQDFAAHAVRLHKGVPSRFGIVPRHGGEVRGEGAVGKGAMFCFSLPLEPVRQFLDSTPDQR